MLKASAWSQFYQVNSSHSVGCSCRGWIDKRFTYFLGSNMSVLNCTWSNMIWSTDIDKDIMCSTNTDMETLEWLNLNVTTCAGVVWMSDTDTCKTLKHAFKLKCWCYKECEIYCPTWIMISKAVKTHFINWPFS